MHYQSVFSRLKKVGLSTAALLSVSNPLLAQNEKPNILWITSEDNSASYMGCYGNEQATTPNIDALAEVGNFVSDMHIRVIDSIKRVI